MSSAPSGYGRVRSFITFLLDAASVAVRDPSTGLLSSVPGLASRYTHGRCAVESPARDCFC